MSYHRPHVHFNFYRVGSPVSATLKCLAILSLIKHHGDMDGNRSIHTIEVLEIELQRECFGFLRLCPHYAFFIRLRHTQRA